MRFTPDEMARIIDALNDFASEKHPTAAEQAILDTFIGWLHRKPIETASGEEGGDPFLEMRGVGREIWKDVDADECVRKLREDQQ